MAISPTRKFIAAAALVAMCHAHTAFAQQCITEGEMTGLAAFALPSVMTGTMRTCRPHLSADGFFATEGDKLIGRYATGRAGSWPAAKAALLKLGGKQGEMDETIARLPDEALQPFAEAMVTEMVGSGIKPDQCVAIERAARLLAPLPPQNTAELVTFMIATVAKPKPGRKADIPICPAGK